MNKPAPRAPMRFVHIGDLHITDGGLPNHIDLGRIIDEINKNATDAIDFVFLPGDNADDGTPEQLALVKKDMSRLGVPWHAIPGDHDFKPKSLQAFYGGLGVRKLPYAEMIAGCQCVFLDVVSHGTGGPDFRLGASQMTWLENELATVQKESDEVAVFMHAFPADLKAGQQELAELFDRAPVRLVDTGHTHYNELINDGRVIYAATRSTGQIEEGEGKPGFAFAAVDRGVVSWRFKPLDSSWPFVMITSPTDRRLAIEPVSDRPSDNCSLEIRASVWGATPASAAEYRIDDGGWRPMTIGNRGLLSADVDERKDRFVLSVRVTDQQGCQDVDVIEVAPMPETRRRPTGSDAGSIGAWPERHLFGTQLGPNRNGKKW